MSSITIDISDDSNKVILTGDIKALCTHRFAIRYLKDYLSPTILENQVIIPIESRSIEQVLSDVRMMLEKYGFSEIKSSSTEKVLLDFYEEEEKFKLFSELALDIRNNVCVREEFESFINVVAEKLPNRSLYELQLLSAYHLAFSQNACNFSVPGAGKTSIVYGAYSYLHNLSDDNNKKIDRILIIGPLSSFGPWELEYLECFGKAPIVKRLVSSISKEEKVNYLYSQYPAEITLVSYASLPSLKDDIIRYLKNNRVMVVLDEAHKIKNISGGIIAQSTLEISKYCKSRVVLTGTPAPNGYEDLYNMFKFIWPSKNIVGYQVNQLKDMSVVPNDARVKNLIKFISPYFIRIRKSDLRVPPATIHAPIEVEMGSYQRRIYDMIEKKYIDSIVKNGTIDMSSKFKTLILRAKMIRLMQAATNPEMLIQPLQEFLDNEDTTDDFPEETFRAINDMDFINEIIRYTNHEVPAKFLVTCELIERIINQGGKVVVWASFIHTIFGLKAYLEKQGIKAQELYGAIPVEKQGLESSDENDELTRERIVREFQKKDCPYQVIIANPFAVAESISLHKSCHNAIYIERTFNAAHFMQSKDRIHRYGLSPDIETHYYFVVAKDSIDETIDKRLELKEARMIEIMENMPIPLFNNVCEDLGDDDIKALLKDYVKRTKKAP
jgi:SNF2 family DNA or RNA helicase